MASEQNSNETNEWDALIRLIDFAQDDTLGLGFLVVLCLVIVALVVLIYLFAFRIPSKRLWKDFEEKMERIVVDLLGNLSTSDDSNSEENSEEDSDEDSDD